jgi:hypothetical protein
MKSFKEYLIVVQLSYFTVFIPSALFVLLIDTNYFFIVNKLFIQHFNLFIKKVQKKYSIFVIKNYFLREAGVHKSPNNKSNNFVL